MKFKWYTSFNEKNKNNIRIKFLYSITLIAGIIGPFTNVPQILKIFIQQNAAGVSLLSWSLYVVFDIPFIIWSIVQRDTPVFVTYSLWLISNFFVVIGILMYR